MNCGQFAILICYISASTVQCMYTHKHVSLYLSVYMHEVCRFSHYFNRLLLCLALATSSI